MKKTILFVLLVASMATFAQKQEEMVFTVVDKAPEFPGGNVAMLRFMIDNTMLPEKYVKEGINQKAMMTFVVNKKGEISDIKVLKGIAPDLDKEAIRLISIMPPWKPGELNGEKVAVQHIMTVKFLSKTDK
jgi:protein TonB